MGLGHLLRDARRFAIEAHGQQRYDGHPYVFHLDQVRDVALEFGVTDEDILVATLLHDTLEDTHVEASELSARFGHGVRLLVEAVTGPRDMKRKEKNAIAYQTILSVGAFAIVLKLCDRIANMRYSVAKGSSLAAMYRAEYPEFRTKLMTLSLLSDDPDLGEVERMWFVLDELAKEE